jgi:hypothetical protein
VEIGDATDQGFKKELALYLYLWIKVGFRTRWELSSLPAQLKRSSFTTDARLSGKDKHWMNVGSNVLGWYRPSRQRQSPKQAIRVSTSVGDIRGAEAPAAVFEMAAGWMDHRST